MPRVAKEKRLRRKQRKRNRARSLAEYEEMAKRFTAFMAEHGLGGQVHVDATGVTITGGGGVVDCSKTGGVGFDL